MRPCVCSTVSWADGTYRGMVAPPSRALPQVDPPSLDWLTAGQGGQATITFNNDLTTLDPQVGYDWQNWSVIKSIFDGLMDYKPGTTELAPDLEFPGSGLTITELLHELEGKVQPWPIRGERSQDGRALRGQRLPARQRVEQVEQGADDVHRLRSPSCRWRG